MEKKKKNDYMKLIAVALSPDTCSSSSLREEKGCTNMYKVLSERSYLIRRASGMSRGGESGG